MLIYRLLLVVEVVVQDDFSITGWSTFNFKTVRHQDITSRLYWALLRYQVEMSWFYTEIYCVIFDFDLLVFFPLDVPKIPEMNLAFAISARAVDGEANFEKMKDILKAIVQKFGSNRIHYSVITFGDPPVTELPFNRRLPSDEILKRFIGKCWKS